MNTITSNYNDTVNSADDGDVEMEDILPHDLGVHYRQGHNTAEQPSTYISGREFMAAWEYDLPDWRLKQALSIDRLISQTAISSLPPSNFVLHDDLSFPTDARGTAITLPQALEQIEEAHKEYRAIPRRRPVPKFPWRVDEEPYNAIAVLQGDLVEDAYLPPMPTSNRSSRASLGRPSLRSLFSVFTRDKNVDRTSKHSASSKRISTASSVSFHHVTGFDRMSFGRQSNVPSMIVDD